MTQKHAFKDEKENAKMNQNAKEVKTILTMNISKKTMPITSKMDGKNSIAVALMSLNVSPMWKIRCLLTVRKLLHGRVHRPDGQYKTDKHFIKIQPFFRIKIL